MSAQNPNLRLEGIYPQRQKGFFMQRVKLAGGIISCDQAQKVTEVARQYARGVMHLTTRGSIELHWLEEENLATVSNLLASVGLVNRGACGGAVRGVICGSMGTASAPKLEALVKRLHRHFTGNPRFEDLPKKFKIGVEASTESRRHLIQDLAIIPAASDGGRPRYDIYVAGGLGREPSPGFLLQEQLPEEKIIPLVEAVVRAYRANTPPPKRLKHLVREIGPDGLRQMVFADPGFQEEVAIPAILSDRCVGLVESEVQRLEIPIFAGELSCELMEQVVAVARQHAGGYLLVTGDQNLVLHLPRPEGRAEAERLLAHAGLLGDSVPQRVRFRVCPGSHECIMGLHFTRDLAQSILDAMGPEAQKLTWALSGCPNSCAQPQLSQMGVIVSKLVSGEGERQPRFDLLRMGEGPFAATVAQGLTREELLQAVAQIG